MRNGIKVLFGSNGWHLILAILCLIHLFFGLQNAPLFDEDEGFTAEVTREMITTGNYITLNSNYEHRYDKPPLAYWAMAGSLLIFGYDEWAVRLPSLLFSLGLAFLLYRFVRNQLNTRQAAIATSMLMGTLQFALMSKSAIPDPPLYFFMSGALFFLYEFIEKGHRRKLVQAYVFMALGFLTKGPVAVAIPALVYLLYAIRWQRWPLLRSVWSVRGLLLFVVLVAPWFWAAYQQVGNVLIDEFLIKHHVNRFAKSMEGHSGPVWYYIPVIILGMLPFSHLLFRAGKSLFRTSGASLPSFLQMWFWIVMLLFSLSATKLPHYVVLGYCPVFILLSSHVADRERWSAGLSLMFLAIIGLLVYGAPRWIPPSADPYANGLIAGFRHGFPPAFWWVWGGCGVVLLWLFLKRRKGSLIAFSLAANTVFYFYAFIQQGPVKKMARIVSSPIHFENHYTPSFSYYRQQAHQVKPLEAGMYSVGKLSDFSAYSYQILYEENGMAWVKITGSRKE